MVAAEQYVDLQSQTTPQLQTAKLIELVLAKGNAAAEVFRNWIQKNDVLLLRDLMGTLPSAITQRHLIPTPHHCPDCHIS